METVSKQKNVSDISESIFIRIRFIFILEHKNWKEIDEYPEYSNLFSYIQCVFVL